MQHPQRTEDTAKAATDDQPGGPAARPKSHADELEPCLMCGVPTIGRPLCKACHEATDPAQN